MSFSSVCLSTSISLRQTDDPSSGVGNFYGPCPALWGVDFHFPLGNGFKGLCSVWEGDVRRWARGREMLPGEKGSGPKIRVSMESFPIEKWTIKHDIKGSENQNKC